MKLKATQMYSRWRQECNRREIPLRKEKQRMPYLTPPQLELLDPKKMTFEDLNGVFERSVRTPNLDPRRQVGPVVPSVPVRERVRRIESTILFQHLGKVRLYTGSTRAVKSNVYWDQRIHVPDFGPLRTWIDTRPLTRPSWETMRRDMRWVPVFKTDLEDYSAQQRQVLK